MIQYLKHTYREEASINKLVQIYCDHHHRDQREGQLCNACNSVLCYALSRLNRCPFASNKPTCQNCLIHCYTPEYKQKTIEIMRFSGPRMIFSSPFLALFHVIDKHLYPPAKL